MFYAIGDIHGEFDLLTRLYAQIQKDQERHGEPSTVVFLGDYIDRGPGSIQVLDWLMNLEDSEQIQHVFVGGNHEWMFIDALENPLSRSDVDFWLRFGGQAVLDEIGMDWDYFRETFPWRKYHTWIKNGTVPYHQDGGYVFCHGGLDIRRKIYSQTPDTFRWSRHMETDHYRNYEFMVIHGHTPTGSPVVDVNRVSVDTSEGNPGMKILTCAVLPSQADGSVRFLKTERYL